MRNGWTGGQYSLLRGVLGIYLALHFGALVPWGAEVFSASGVLPDASVSHFLFDFPNVLSVLDSTAFVTGLLVLGIVLGLVLAAGWHDRVAALVLWYIWACLLGRNPLTSSPGQPYVGWLLLAHVLVPAAPYGSLAARGRADPDGGWRMPPGIFAAAWIVLSLGYTFSAVTRLASPSWIDGTAVARILQSPLARPGIFRDALALLPSPLLSAVTWGALAAELAFAPLALFPRLRPWIWTALLILQAGVVAIAQLPELGLGIALLHLFTFDPGWVKPRKASAAGRGDVVFYDGHCGLCHGFVRLLLAEDRAEPVLRFAPLESEAFLALPAERRAGLPDSVVVQSEGGKLLIRSNATIHLLASLGGLWRILGGALRLCPRPARDLAYDLIAKVRKRLVPAPDAACPVVPPALRGRFL